jgi:type II secretory pathway component GspD/PulD (secretin)
MGGGMKQPLRWAFTCAAVAAIMVIGAVTFVGPAVAGQDIPWKGTEIFNRVSVDEDIKDTLRRIVSQNGQEAVFRPGVESSVSFDFSNMPLEAAFNKLITENGLDYDYDSKTGLITISSTSKGERVKAFLPLVHATRGAVMSAVRKFELGGNTSFDERTRTVLLEGTRNQVKALTALIERVDVAAGARLAAAAAQVKVGLAEEETRVQSELLNRVLTQDMRVIRLRYASVASTKKTFLGKEVKVPGIEETIRALLGDTADLKEKLPKEFQEELEELAPGTLSGLFISTDPRTNSVIIRGTPADLDSVEALVRKLDEPVPLIQIEILIVRAQRGVSETFGVNWAAERNQPNDTRGLDKIAGFNTGISQPDPSGITAGLGETGAVAAVAGATGTTETVASAQQAAAVDDINSALQTFVFGAVYQGTHLSLQAQIEAFEQDNMAQTISSPTLITTNNVAARIERTASQFINVSVGDSSSLEEVDVGLSLTLTPSVIPRAKADEQVLVRMVINARNTSVSAGTFSSSTASTSGQEIQTEVIIPSGRTFILGGLADDTRVVNEKGIPFLRSLPVIGKLFGTESSTDEFVQTLFFVTPTVIYPERIRARDIAERRYLQSRKFGLAESRRALQGGSNVLVDKLAYQEEDE